MIVGSVLMCHAPIVIPAVGGDRGEDCAVTTRSMAAAAEALVTARPDVVVCLSPHTPRRRTGFTLLPGGARGDFARFGAPEARVDFPGDEGALRAILAAAGPDLAAPADDLETRLDRGRADGLDHGAAVPLWFVAEAGYTGPVVVVGLPWDCTHARCRAFGRALSFAADADGRRFFVLASGDMSHCLKPGAPSGFHRDGARFDRAFVQLLRERDGEGRALADALQRLDELREHAAEDVVDTFEVAAASLAFAVHPEVLSYEGPFGVGYTVARLA